MTTATDRRLRLLEFIPRSREGGITVPRLAQLLSEEGIETTARTLQRDLQTLSLNYPLTCNDEAKPYKWCWASDDILPVPAMGPFTALTFQLAERILHPLLPAQALEHLQPNFNTARDLLERKARQKARRWLSKVRIVPRCLQMEPAPLAEGVYDAITSALYEEQQVELRYLAASSQTGEPLSYAVHPYALLHRDTTTELVGRIEGDSTIRRWVLHRIQQARVLDLSTICPPDFDLDAYLHRTLAYPLSGEEITLRAWIADDLLALNHVRETRLSTDQILERSTDGWMLTARLRESIELKWWILGLGERIRILEPESLREDIHRTLTAASRLYGSDKTPTGDTAS